MVSVAEDIVMRMLILMRNFLPAYHQIINGDWNVAQVHLPALPFKCKNISVMCETHSLSRRATSFTIATPMLSQPHSIDADTPTHMSS